MLPTLGHAAVEFAHFFGGREGLARGCLGPRCARCARCARAERTQRERAEQALASGDNAQWLDFNSPEGTTLDLTCVQHTVLD